MFTPDTNIILIGLNHNTASVDIREQFALSNNCEGIDWVLPNCMPIEESLILSTCNRVEMIAVGQGDFAGHMLTCWAGAKNANHASLSRYVYKYYNADAIEHLFSVASSLDSMVLGEPQILGQLKDAYRKASIGKHTGRILNRLLHKSFYVAKRVRTETAVASNAVSISYAAVEMAKRIFGDMHMRSALLIGAGEMAELAANHLVKAGIKKLFIANRTFANCLRLARKINGIAVEFDNIPQLLCNVDIVIASTGSMEPLITLDSVEKILKLRKNRPMFFIDIAVPRDIDPAINELDNIHLYDIDDLKDIIEENMATRRNEANRAHEIIVEEVDLFLKWIDELNLQSTIVQLVDQGKKIALEEVKKTMKHFHSGDPTIEKYITIMAQSIINKMNHAPIDFIRKYGLNDKDNHRNMELVKKIFNIS